MARSRSTVASSKRGSIRASTCPFVTTLLKSTLTLAIGPEVNAPTDTDRTGLTVPVEVTTVATRPRDTVVVTYLGKARFAIQDFIRSRASAPPPTRTPRMRSHFRSLRTMQPLFPPREHEG